MPIENTVIEKVIASRKPRDGCVPVECSSCGTEYHVPEECVDENGRINVDGLFGAYLSAERFLYCDLKCWSDFCSD